MELLWPSLYYNGNISSTSLLGERWQYAVLPPASAKVQGSSSSSSKYGMGTTGWVASGAVLFNEASSPDGSLAAYYEYESLDSCHGHRSESEYTG